MLAELTLRAGSEIARAAVVVDVREGKTARRVPGHLPAAARRCADLNPVLIFLEAAEPALVRRFSETRRPHPLAPDRSASEGIREERNAMRAIREHGRRHRRHVGHDRPRTAARLHWRRARQRARHRSWSSRSSASASSTASRSTPICCSTSGSCRIRISCRRCGRTPAATARWCRYLDARRRRREFLDTRSNLLKFLIPQYVAEGKSYLTIGIGCTGGRHRSVVIAEALRKGLSGLARRPAARSRTGTLPSRLRHRRRSGMPS